MELIKRNNPLARPVRVLQFGEGNFIRAFMDWMVDRLNRLTDFNGAVRIVKPRSGGTACQKLNVQDGLCHVVLRGIEDGKVIETPELIECVKDCLDPIDDWDKIVKTARSPELRFVFSNTTEAGIEYRAGADTFPAKVARLLAERAKTGLPGLVFLPCELIENNGGTLRDCILKYLEGDSTATEYVLRECIFCNTLVDRIVAGFPKNDAERYFKTLGVEDQMLVCGEPFFFLAIEAPADIQKELPTAAAGLNVVFTQDLSPYRTRKVRFLNGAHTSSVLGAHLAGLTFVDEMVRDKTFGAFLRKVLFEEVLPTIALSEAEKRAYAESVLERFANPYAEHRLLSIALNSTSKWRVRVLPTLLDYIKIFGKLPPCLTQSMAFLVDFYRTCEFQDTPEVAEFFARKPTLHEILSNTDFWGMDLTQIDGFETEIKKGLRDS
ncbi:MAG: tagaturonate reductase [Lentisphaeria bacterium]|nr:tagaturonate reductase [Lentisphaeria bacterium]